MKKTFIYSIIILLAACLASCEKNEGPVGAAEGTITFAPSAVKTRALIEDEAALQAVTFQVYDYLDDAEYINNKVAYADGAWAYTDEQTYLWKNGTHRLFGFSDGLGTLSEGKVAVSKVLTDQTQDDLLYSEIVKTTAAEWKSAAGHTTETPVSLNMKHLLSAVAITVQNFSGNEVTLNSVSKPAIPNSGSATVDFSGDAVAVEYGDVSVSGEYLERVVVFLSCAPGACGNLDRLIVGLALHRVIDGDGDLASLFDGLRPYDVVGGIGGHSLSDHI